MCLVGNICWATNRTNQGPPINTFKRHYRMLPSEGFKTTYNVLLLVYFVPLFYFFAFHLPRLLNGRRQLLHFNSNGKGASLSINTLDRSRGISFLIF